MKHLRHRRRRVHRLQLRPPRARAPPTTRSRSSTRSPTPATSPTSRDVDDDPRFRFVQGDICDRGRGATTRWTATTRSCTSPPRATSTARSSAPTTSSAPTASAPTCCATSPASVGVERVPAHLHRRGLRLDRGRLVHARPTRSSPARRTRRRRPGSDLIALSYHDDLRPAGRRHPLVEQLRAVPVPREGHPAVHHQPARRREGAALRRRPQRPRLAATSTTTAPASTSCCARARSARSTTSAPATRSPTASSPTSCSRSLGRDETSSSTSTDRLGHDRRYSVDIDQGHGARLAPRARRSTRRSRRPSPGTATTAGGGSRSSAARRADAGPRHRRRRPARPRPGRRPARRPTTSSRADHAHARRRRPRRRARRRHVVRPDVVVHCAAWTAVDACEARPRPGVRASTRSAVRWRGRGGAPGRRPPRATCRTDYVFDGTKPDARTTSGTSPNPQSVYGRSKLAGEREARRPAPPIVRTSWVCGAHGGNMVKTDAAPGRRARRRCRFVDDQRGPPDLHRRPGRRMLRRLAVDRRPGIVPRHQPGRGQLVRVRPGGRSRRPGDDPARVAPDRHRRPRSRPARRRARPTPCSTTPRCGARAWRWPRTSASRSTASWRACCSSPQKWSLYDHFQQNVRVGGRGRGGSAELDGAEAP